jgi:uracil-DNA glycosylase
MLNNDWAPLLGGEFEKQYFIGLRQFLAEEYREHTVYPEEGDLYNSLRLTPYAGTKAVILGQDPYHGPGQAHGLSFSVKPGVAPPPSLHNMFKELRADVGCGIPNNGYLVPWAEQGVLLLNTVLTVRAGLPASHRGKGWEIFTDRVIALLNEREQPLVFVLWGNHARQKERLIDSGRHLVLKAPHPSPLSASRGFFGSRPFSRINRFLEETGRQPINWQLPDL